MRPGDQGEIPRRTAEHVQSGKLVRKIKSHSTLRTRLEAGRWRKVVWTGSGLVALSVAVWGGVRLIRGPDMNDLLARAYTERRTIELRMPGAAYAPMRVERGAGQAHENAPASLLEAEMILTRDANKHVEDPAWLQAQARASLLEWDYEDAIKKFDAALMLKPDDPEMLQGRATAYFERAEKLGPQGAIDYGEATEDLSKALKKNRDDHVALFNRAIVFEKLYLLNEAIADFERYLQLEPAGLWAGEAKERVQRLRKLVKDHEAALAEPLADPITFVRLVSDPAGANKLDQRIEDYQDLAIREWLPHAFPVAGSTAAPAARGQFLPALHALAKLLLDRHNDRWLSDLLEPASNTPTFASAIWELKEAVTSSNAGDASGAIARAAKAAGFFAAASNKSGELRSHVEEVYALQRGHQSDRCIEVARRVESQLSDKGYSWMSAQIGIDHSNCLLKSASFDAGKAYVSSALKQTLENGFPNLRLRAIGSAASADDFEGDLSTAWAGNEQGLAEYWERNPSPPVRAHQFYDILTYSAEKMGRPNLALAFGQESVRMLSLAGNRKVEILARQHLATIAVTAKELTIARAELQKANELSAGSSESQSEHSARVYSEIALAEIDLQQGLIAQADARLQAVRPELPSVALLTTTLSFYQAKANLLARQGKSEEAVNELLNAIDEVESRLGRLGRTVSRESWSHENEDIYRSLVSLEISGGRSEDAFNTWEWYRSAGLSGTHSSSLKQFLGRGGLRNYVSTLGNQTVVSYALVPRGLTVWVADNRGIRVHVSKLDSANLQKLTSMFLTLCADPSSDLKMLQTRAKQLFAILIAPIAQDLDAHRVIVIEPDELFGDLPFQALAGPDGKYLAETYTMVFSPGLLYQEHLRNPAPISPEAKALIVGSTAHIISGGASLQPDEAALEEAREVAGRFVHPKVLLRNQATKDSIDRALPNAEVFHFVGHALSSVQEEGLLLDNSRAQATGTSLWKAQDTTFGLFKKCQLTVLSACSTGKTYRSRRESHGQTIRSMLAAGVPSVVASRWDVDSMQTRNFATIFYNALFSRKPVPEAVKHAELGFLNHRETRHPYYWAAFAVFGHA